MKQYIEKSDVVAEIDKRIKSLEGIGSEDYLHDNYPEQYAMLVTLKSLKISIDTLEMKEVDLEKEKVEIIKKQCPFREVVCIKYQNHQLKCSGACAFVSDRITLEKKHLHDIQNVPVDEEILKMDRRNTV